MNIKSFIFLFIGILLVAPLLVSADELNTYQFSDSGNYVHYEGLVPCGKDLWISSDEAGLNDVIMGHVPCQFCHIFIMLATIMGFLLTRLIPILAVGMLLVAGIMYYLALGNPEKFKKVNKVFSGVLIGLVLIYGAWLIIGALFSILGVAEWTGLQSGWYQINCPVKHVVYNPVEFKGLAEEACPPGHNGPSIDPPGYLCTTNWIFSSTISQKVNAADAYKICQLFTMRLGIKDWGRPLRSTFFEAADELGEYLKCGEGCLSWDSNCCTESSRGSRAYWTSEEARSLTLVGTSHYVVWFSAQRFKEEYPEDSTSDRSVRCVAPRQ